MISIFHGDDESSHEGYQSWRRANTDGFLMTEGRKGLFTIHYSQDMRDNPDRRGCNHTGGSSIRYGEDGCYTRARKVCSERYEELIAWAGSNKFETKACKNCDTKLFPFASVSQPANFPAPPSTSTADVTGARVTAFLPTSPTAVPSKSLAQRSDEDVEYLRDAATLVMRRRHNEMTNDLLAACKKLGLDVQEGSEQACLFDALILRYRPGNRQLLVEVKTESGPPYCRMAVGQLLDYRWRLPDPEVVDLAVLLPEKPADDMRSYLEHVGVLTLWLDDRREIPGLAALIDGEATAEF